MMDIISSSSTRIKTGLALLAALLIVGFIDSFLITWILFGGLLVISINEAMKLYGIEDSYIYAYIGAVWFFAYFYPKPEDLIFIVAIIFASILAYTKELDKRLFFILLYPVASYLFILSLYIEFGMASLLWLLFVVAGADVGAYFTGMRIGKTKFCQTSPNKTWEGVAGGIIAAGILGAVFAIEQLSLIGGVLISIAVAAASIFGDLFESYLKREAGVKDSGDILPGHGGILDRVDSYLFGGVVMLVLLRMVV